MGAGVASAEGCADRPSADGDGGRGRDDLGARWPRQCGVDPKVEGNDPAIDTWKAGPDLPVPLNHAMAVEYGGELVVLGGWVPKGPNLTGTTSDRVLALRNGKWWIWRR